MNQYLHQLSTMKGVEASVIGIDFDGTIAKQIPYQGPGVFGEPVASAAAAMKYIKSLGYMIAIYTSRGTNSYRAIREYMFKHKILFDYINENPHTLKFKDSNIVKPNYDIYIDDKNIRFCGNWANTIQDIKKHKFPYWMKDR